MQTCSHHASNVKAHTRRGPVLRSPTSRFRHDVLPVFAHPRPAANVPHSTLYYFPNSASRDKHQHCSQHPLASQAPSDLTIARVPLLHPEQVPPYRLVSPQEPQPTRRRLPSPVPQRRGHGWVFAGRQHAKPFILGATRGLSTTRPSLLPAPYQTAIQQGGIRTRPRPDMRRVLPPAGANRHRNSTKRYPQQDRHGAKVCDGGPLPMALRFSLQLRGPRQHTTILAPRHVARVYYRSTSLDQETQPPAGL